MAKLRKDIFTARKSRWEKGRATFYGTNFSGHPPVRIDSDESPFKYPIDNMYGRHVTFGKGDSKKKDDKKDKE